MTNYAAESILQTFFYFGWLYYFAFGDADGNLYLS